MDFKTNCVPAAAGKATATRARARQDHRHGETRFLDSADWVSCLGRRHVIFARGGWLGQGNGSSAAELDKRAADRAG